MLYPLPALVTPFPRIFFIKGNSCLIRTLMEAINEEAIGCINEEKP